MALQPS